MSQYTKLLSLALVGCLPLSCGVDGISILSQKKEKKEAAEVTGNLAEGQFTSGSDTEQSLSAPSGTDIDGAGINFPAGSLELDTLVSIGSGASITNESVVAELGISDSNVSQAGPAVVFNSSTDLNASEQNPFQLQLPLSSGAGLNLLACPNLIVIYHQKRVTESKTVENYYGVFKKDQIEVIPGFIKVKTRYFGSYQPACTEQEITKEVVAVKTTAPIIQKISSLPYVGLWESGCKSRDEERDEGSTDGDSVGGETPDEPNDDFGQSAIQAFLDPGNTRAAEIAAALEFTQSDFDRIEAAAGGDADTGRQHSERIFFAIAKDTFNFRSIEYYGSNCLIPARSSVMTGDVKFVGKSDLFEDTENIDVTFRTMSMKTISKYDSFVFRYENVCGRSDWGPGTPIDINSETCPKIERDGENDPGREFKSILQVKGDSLRMGTKDDENGDDSIRDDKLEEETLSRVK